MLRMSSLTGLPVILNGQVCGHVEQPVLQTDGRRLRGVTVRSGLRGARWVNRPDILVVGSVSVVIGAKPGRIPPNIDYSLGRVTDSTGLRLGLVTDVYLDPVALHVEALEITLGLVEALTCGPVICRQFRMLHEEDGTRVIIPCTAALTHVSSPPSG